MRFKREVSKPNIGDTALRSAFLFLPMIIGSDVRWLEFAKWREEFKSFALTDDWNETHEHCAWTAVEWINNDNKEIGNEDS